MNNAECVAALDHAAAPLRVLDITKFYSAHSGGVKTYLDAKIADFATRFVEHTLLVPGEQVSESHQGRSRICTIPGPTIPFSPAYRLITSTQAVRQHLQQSRPQIIEVGSPFLVPHLVRRALGRSSNTRLIGFYHSDLIRTYAEPLTAYALAAPARVIARNAARAYIKRLYSAFDATIAASASVVAELRTLGVPNVFCVPLGVDLTLFRPGHDTRFDLHARLGIAPGRPIGLFVGRFCAEKRLDVVLQALHRLPAPERPHLVLVGAGVMLPELEALARQGNDLSLLPYTSDRRQLARIYRAADFYVAPGPGETFGLAIAEAMASGLPVLAVERGAAPDRIGDSSCGRLYAHGSAESCAQALRVLTRSLSPLQRARARRHAELRFSWRRTFDLLLSVYQEVLSTRVTCRVPI